MKTKMAAAAAVLLLVLVPPFIASAAEKTAGGMVRSFQDGLGGVMQNAKQLGLKGRYDALAPIIEKSFHLPVMISSASRPYWRAASDDQRGRLIAAFRRMSISAVATLFDNYDGETFKVVRERDVEGPTVLVDTQIVPREDDPVDITYVTARIKDRWWIIDVIVGGGISEIAVRRSEYLALLKEGGPERLILALEGQADRLLAGAEKAVIGGGRP
jgi:phospholipid transport system substrate-binding protein